MRSRGGLLRSTFFTRTVGAARRAAGDKTRLGRLAALASRLLRNPAAALGRVRGDALAMARMVREVAAGRYRRPPTRTLVAAVAGLLYLVDPLDLVPDILPAIGLVDDAAVLVWVLSQIRRDLDRFLEWEREWGGAIDAEVVDSQPEVPPQLPG